MDKKQAVERRIRELVESLDASALGDEFCRKIRLNHVFMALKEVKETLCLIDPNGRFHLYEVDVDNGAGYTLTNVFWNFEKTYHDQDDEVFDFLHDLLIENV